MNTLFITNGKGKKIAVIIPIKEYEDLLHRYHFDLELRDEYKAMIDSMLMKKKTVRQNILPFNTSKIGFQASELGTKN